MFLFTIENFHDRLKTERLYLSYRKLMYKEAFEIVQNRHCAEDAVSESFVRIIDNLHKIDEQDCLKTRSFLVIICRNVAKYATRAACVLLVIAIYNPLPCAFLTFPFQWCLTIYNILFMLVSDALIIIAHNVFLAIGIAVSIYMHISPKNSFDFFRIL